MNKTLIAAIAAIAIAISINPVFSKSYCTKNGKNYHKNSAECFGGTLTNNKPFIITRKWKKSAKDFNVTFSTKNPPIKIQCVGKSNWGKILFTGEAILTKKIQTVTWPIQRNYGMKNFNCKKIDNFTKVIKKN